jgi:transforming growth factor-beta-induced protein
LITFLLAYHAIDVSLPSSDIDSGFFITGNGNALFVEKMSDTGNVMVNAKALIVSPDIKASNGIIHIIDEFLLPPMFDVTGIAANDENLSILMGLLTSAGLLETLRNPGPFTVFAPTDTAFMKLGQTTIDALKADTNLLKEILLYHVTLGSIGSGQLVGRSEIKTQSGATIGVSSDGLVLNNIARFEDTNILAKNGVVHLIDTVLIPPALEDPA